MQSHWVFQLLPVLLRQTIGSFHIHCLPHFHIFWGIHESLQFAVIHFPKELGNLIRKQEFSSLWTRAQYSLRLQRELLLQKWFRKRRQGGGGGALRVLLSVIFWSSRNQSSEGLRVEGSNTVERICSYLYQKLLYYNIRF